MERDKENQIIFIEKIKKLEAKYNEVVKFVEEIRNAGVRIFINEKWQIKNNLFIKKENIYAPRNNKLRLEIILLYHDKSIADHG